MLANICSIVAISLLCSPMQARSVTAIDLLPAFVDKNAAGIVIKHNDLTLQATPSQTHMLALGITTAVAAAGAVYCAASKKLIGCLGLGAIAAIAGLGAYKNYRLGSQQDPYNIATFSPTGLTIYSDKGLFGNVPQTNTFIPWEEIRFIETMTNTHNRLTAAQTVTFRDQHRKKLGKISIINLPITTKDFLNLLSDYQMHSFARDFKRAAGDKRVSRDVCLRS